jgi:hypothetical protein
MKKIALFLATALACSFGTAEAEIEVKNTAGQSMKIEVLKYTASSGNVRIQRNPDGTIFNLKIDLFDAESQAKIKEAAPKAMPKLDIKVSAGARRATVGNSAFMERQEITATVEVKNTSRDIDLAETKFTILLVGRNTRRFANRDDDGAKILSNQSASGSAVAGQSLRFEFKPVMTEYDEDKDSSNLGGWDYDGYLLVMQNKNGEIIEAKTSIGPVESDILKDHTLLKKAIALKEGTQISRNLKL